MMCLRRGLYRIGYRPRRGSIWFSPSLAMIYAGKDFGVVFKAALDKQMKEMRDEGSGSTNTSGEDPGSGE
jgi:hypothetical protein